MKKFLAQLVAVFMVATSAVAGPIQGYDNIVPDESTEYLVADGEGVARNVTQGTLDSLYASEAQGVKADTAYSWGPHAGLYLTGVTGSEAAFSGWDKNAADDFDGAYSSLLGAPVIPTDNSQLANGAGYVTGIDARLSDARYPTSHSSSHAVGGADEITPAQIGAATEAQGDLAASALQPDGDGSQLTGITITESDPVAGAALTTHEGAADPHTGYLLESAAGTAAFADTGTTIGTLLPLTADGDGDASLSVPGSIAIGAADGSRTINFSNTSAPECTEAKEGRMYYYYDQANFPGDSGWKICVLGAWEVAP